MMQDEEELLKTMYAVPEKTPVKRTESRLLAARDKIQFEQPNRTDFLHTVMCLVGMPRKATDAKVFERQNGHISILLEAGKLYNGREWIQHPLPYGTTPRLVMIHLSSEAIRTQNRSVEIGDSMKEFLQLLGMPITGGERGGYTIFRKQMEALAACRLTLGMESAGQVVTMDAKPIKKFQAWLQLDDTQPTLWPGMLELSQDFFDTLNEHAVPLDYRAIAALKHSALALDVYTWLAHRLCRITKHEGVTLSWANIREQFGQEYADPKNFKREFRDILNQVLTVYPNARIDSTAGGIILKSSLPPISKTIVSLASPEKLPVDKSGG